MKLVCLQFWMWPWNMALKYRAMRRLFTLVSQSHLPSNSKSCHPYSITYFPHRMRKHQYHIVSPGSVSALRKVPDSVPKPAYAVRGSDAIVVPREAEVKTADQIEGMRRACTLAASLLQFTGSYLQVHVWKQQQHKIPLLLFLSITLLVLPTPVAIHCLSLSVYLSPNPFVVCNAGTCMHTHAHACTCSYGHAYISDTDNTK